MKNVQKRRDGERERAHEKKKEEVDVVVVEGNVKYKISLICVVRTLDTNTL